MLGVLYELGRAVYKWAAGFAIAWSFISALLVLIGGDYIARWVPTTPFSTFALLARAVDASTTIRALAMSALSMAFAVAIIGMMGFLSSQYYLSISFRTSVALLDLAITSSLIQVVLSAVSIAAGALGPGAALALGGFGALVIAAVTVYQMFYLAGVQPPS